MKAKVQAIDQPRYFFFFFGTFFPALRACDRPIAMACFRLFTRRPLPLLSVPFFRSCIALPTFLEDALEYFRAAMLYLLGNTRAQREYRSSGSA
jgi:hypothetical protein